MLGFGISGVEPSGSATTVFVNVLYEARLKSSWTRIITPSRNFVEVR